MSVFFSYAFMATFFCGIILIFFLKSLVLKHKFLVSKGVPLVGGPALAIAFLACVLVASRLYGIMTYELLGLCAASFLMLVFGILDDWRELSIPAKFAFEIVATILLVVFGVKTQIVGLGSVGNIIVTFVWVLAVTNAFNHLDIMDAVTGLSAFIIGAGLFVISVFGADMQTALLCCILCGATLSFLTFNLPPARIYLGNSGSHFLGFVFSGIALIISYASLERPVALISPILIMGLPLYDTIFLVLVRILKGKIPFKKSNDHLTLRFRVLGLSVRKIICIILLLNLMFVSTGIIVSRASNLGGLAVIFVTSLVILGVTLKMAKVKVDV